MKELVRKEIIVNRNYVFYGLLLPLFTIMVTVIEEKLQVYIMFSYAVALVSLTTIWVITVDKNRKDTDKFFLSLAIDRDNIIKSKYLVYSIFPLIFSLILYVFAAILKWPFSFQPNKLDFDVVIIATAVSIIFLAFFIPIRLKKSKGIPIFDILLYILFIWSTYNLPSLVFELNSSINFEFLTIALSIVAIIFYFISLKISTKILKKRWLEE